MENEEDKITAYLNNKLTPAEREAFEKAMQNNPALEKNVRFQQDLLLVGDIFSEGGIKDQLETTWRENQSKESKPRSISPRVWRMAAVVALLIVAGILIWNFLGNKKNSKEFWQDAQAYAQLLTQQKQLHQSQQIAELDNMLDATNKAASDRVLYPTKDTLLASQNPILFQWIKEFQGKNLELQVFTKATETNPKVYSLPKNTNRYQISLSAGLYYWRLSIKDEEVLENGRFYVVTVKK